MVKSHDYSIYGNALARIANNRRPIQTGKGRQPARTANN
jgi:hypothetical protein